jgi:iron(III) transport system substrate-binding protein
MARSPKGGDTDQIRAVASGECGVALTNSYYLARLMRSTKPEDIALMSKIGFVWPNQNAGGVHINISGGGVAKNAPHPAAAVQFWSTWLVILRKPIWQMETMNGRLLLPCA